MKTLTLIIVLGVIVLIIAVGGMANLDNEMHKVVGTENPSPELGAPSAEAWQCAADCVAEYISDPVVAAQCAAQCGEN